MYNHLQIPFKAPFVRCGFAAGAIVMTVAIPAIIDGLASTTQSKVYNWRSSRL